MSAAMIYVSIGAGLTLGVGILTVAVLFLQTARRYVDLAEKRLELLQEGEEFLLKVVQRQGLALEESREREAHQRERVPEMVGYPPGRRQGEESPGSRRPPEGKQGNPVQDDERSWKSTSKSDAAVSPPKDGVPLLGVQVPHPDDDVPGRGWSKAPARFFQKYYDRYLEHYEGYVRLAERIHGMRGEAGTRAWEDKLRRAYDAIERTTQRLDMLEEHYPELATDGDRISSRIGTARLHASLAERFGRVDRAR